MQVLACSPNEHVGEAQEAESSEAVRCVKPFRAVGAIRLAALSGHDQLRNPG